MFDFLKKKIADFTGKLKDTLQTKKEEPQAQPAVQQPTEPKTISEKAEGAKQEAEAKEKQAQEKLPETKPEQDKPTEKIEAEKKISKVAKPEEPAGAKTIRETKEAGPEEEIEAKLEEEPEEEIEEADEELEEEKEEAQAKPKEEPKPQETKIEAPAKPEEKSEIKRLEVQPPQPKPQEKVRQPEPQTQKTQPKAEAKTAEQPRQEQPKQAEKPKQPEQAKPPEPAKAEAEQKKEEKKSFTDFFKGIFGQKKQEEKPVEKGTQKPEAKPGAEPQRPEKSKEEKPAQKTPEIKPGQQIPEKTTEEKPGIKIFEPKPTQRQKAEAEKAVPEKMQPAEPKEIFKEAPKGESLSAEKMSELKVDDKRELKADTGIFQKVVGLVSGKIKVTEKDTRDFFDEFELSLLEADVEQETALAIVAQLKGQLVGREISSKEDLTKFLGNEIRKALAKIMETEKVDFGKYTQKPLKILFLGPNGAGKTTSIAKIANYFMKNGKSVIMAAGDTFRAASIEQLETHANRLGVKIVKQNYGADPAAVAFDAVKAAEAKNIDVVLIDTAGRQETNRNLVEELKKIERVVKPDLKLYVGEAYTGQALLQQAGEFDKAIGLDGFVLTKIDADAKGGTAISLLYTLKKPIVFVGTGQGYDDLLEFRPEFIIDRII